MSIHSLNQFSKFSLTIENAQLTQKGNALKLDGVKKPQKIEAVSQQFFHLLKKEKLALQTHVSSNMKGEVEVVTGFNNEQWNALMREVDGVMRCQKTIVQLQERLNLRVAKTRIHRIFKAVSQFLFLLRGLPLPSSKSFQSKMQNIYHRRFVNCRADLKRMPIPLAGKKLIEERLAEAEKTVILALQQRTVTPEMMKGIRPPPPKFQLKESIENTPILRKRTPRKLKPQPGDDLFSAIQSKKAGLKHVSPSSRAPKTPIQTPRERLIKSTLSAINSRVADSPLDSPDEYASWTP